MSLRGLLTATTQASFDAATDTARHELEAVFDPELWGIEFSLSCYTADNKANIWRNELRSTIQARLLAAGTSEADYAAFLGDVHYSSVAIYWRNLFDHYRSNRGWRILIMAVPAVGVMVAGLASHYQNAQQHNKLGQVSNLLLEFALAALTLENQATDIGRAVEPDDWDKAGLLRAPVLAAAGLPLPPNENGHGLYIKDVRTTTVKKILASYISVSAFEEATVTVELPLALAVLESSARFLATTAYPFSDLAAFEQVRSLALTDLAAARNRIALRSRRGRQSVVRTYYGPPGTGKTLAAVRDAVALADPQFKPTADDAKEYFTRFNDLHEQVAFVTFHQSLQYEDLVESIRPSLAVPTDAISAEAGENIGSDSAGEADGPTARDESEEPAALRYFIYEGPLLRLVRRATEHPNDEHVLVVDEINRGDISRILGPLISTLDPDKRAGADFPIGFERQYPRTVMETRVFVPSNLHVIGTMNSADRNIALVDYALRRRFEFVECPPRPELLKPVDGEPGVDLPPLLQIMNRRIEFLLDRDHCIGHSYFMGCRKPLDVVAVFATRIIPMLYEYFYGNERLATLVVADSPDGANNIFVVREEDAAFQELFGRDAAAAGALGYRARGARVTVSLDSRFWNVRRLVPGPDDEAYAIGAVRKIYAAPVAPT